jgi:hypothetical protein
MCCNGTAVDQHALSPYARKNARPLFWRLLAKRLKQRAYSVERLSGFARL